MKTSKEDILSRLSAIFDEGELTEEKVKIVEDISDTFDELSRASGDVEEVEKKWRKRYIERFGNPTVDDEGEKIEKTETIKIYDRFQGFMGRCCSYEVVEPKLYIFEKHLGYINIERPIDANKNEFSLKNNTIIYKYNLDNDGQTTVRDTTEILTFE